jgi:chromosome segregation ATPase
VTLEGMAPIIALIAMLILHFARGPNKQYEDLRADMVASEALLRSEITKLTEENKGLQRDLNALDRKLAGEYMGKPELKELIRDMRDEVGHIRKAVNEMIAVVAKLNNGERGVRA